MGKIIQKLPAFLTQFRLAIYIIYFLQRFWVIRRDALFPIYDGLGYFIKACWMAGDPLHNSFGFEAFEYLAVRPPGSMWLSLPGMLLRPSFSVFASMLMIWMLVFLEIGLQGIFRGRRKNLRGAAALLILGGLGVMYDALAPYYVDMLFVGETVAAVGLAVWWMRRGGWGKAVACGLCLSLCVLTKPSGLFTYVAVFVAVMGGRAVLWLQYHEKGMKFFPPKKGILQGLVLTICAMPGLFGLFFTPYSFVITGMSIPLSETTLGRVAVQDKFSLDALITILRQFVEDLGLPLAIMVLGGIGAHLLPSERIRRPDYSIGIGLLLAAAVLIFYMLLVPMKMHRYIAPGSAVLLCAFTWLMARRGPSRVFLGFTLLLVILWRGLFFVDLLPKEHWVRFTGGRYSMRPIHEFLGKMNAIMQESSTPEPLVFASEVSHYTDALWTVQQVQAHEIKPALRIFGFAKNFNLNAPSFPNFDLAHMPKFLEADILIVAKPNDALKFDPASTSADWKRLNDMLWQEDAARRAGFDLAFTHDTVKVFKARSFDMLTADLPAVSRARILLEAGFQSPEGKIQSASLAGITRLESIEPRDRSLIFARGDQGLGFLMHAPYAGNKLPESAIMELEKDDRIYTQLRASDWGDGVIVRLEPVGVNPATNMPYDAMEVVIDPGGFARIDLANSPGGWWRNAERLEIRLNVFAGKKGNTQDDCITLWIRPKNDDS